MGHAKGNIVAAVVLTINSNLENPILIEQLGRVNHVELEILAEELVLPE